MAQVVGVDLNENHPLPVNWVDLKLSESINLPVKVRGINACSLVLNPTLYFVFSR